MDFTEKYYEDIIKDIKEVTLVPSPPFKEQIRVFYLKNYTNRIGYNNTRIDDEGNLIVSLEGKNPKTIVFSAHTDTVFQRGTKLSIKEAEKTIACPGICDNSTGIVAQLYLMRYIKENGIIPRHNLVFLFNVGEEELGNLRGIKYFFDNFNQKELLAHICIEGHRIGRITKKMVGSHRRKITIRTKGGHSWRDYGNANAILVASNIIQKLSNIKLYASPKTILNIGTINGGKSVNSIPSFAEFSIDIRSLKQIILSDIISKVDSTIKLNPYNVKSDILGERPCGEMKETWLIDLIKKVQNNLGISTLEDEGSTDSNYPISLGLPSVTIGITEAKNTHSDKEYLFKDPIKKGVKQLIGIFLELDSIQK